jgi:hypothetical protein
VCFRRFVEANICLFVSAITARSCA